jgi:rhodanese-related sulfurtransferase
MPTGFKQMLAQANAVIETHSVHDAMAMVGKPDLVFVDVRDGHEVRQSGMLPGAVHASRGLLEFQIDADSPMHNAVFSGGKSVVFYCGTGGRSALATKLALDMGLENVSHVAGGFAAWKEAGGTIEPWQDE